MSKQSKFQYLIYSLLLALLIGGLIMWATGSNPFAHQVFYIQYFKLP